MISMIQIFRSFLRTQKTRRWKTLKGSTKSEDKYTLRKSHLLQNKRIFTILFKRLCNGITHPLKETLDIIYGTRCNICEKVDGIIQTFICPILQPSPRSNVKSGFMVFCSRHNACTINSTEKSSVLPTNLFQYQNKFQYSPSRVYR